MNSSSSSSSLPKVDALTEQLNALLRLQPFAEAVAGTGRTSPSLEIDPTVLEQLRPLCVDQVKLEEEEKQEEKEETKKILSPLPTPPDDLDGDPRLMRIREWERQTASALGCKTLLDWDRLIPNPGQPLEPLLLAHRFLLERTLFYLQNRCGLAHLKLQDIAHHVVPTQKFIVLLGLVQNEFRNLGSIVEWQSLARTWTQMTQLGDKHSVPKGPLQLPPRLAVNEQQPDTIEAFACEILAQRKERVPLAALRASVLHVIGQDDELMVEEPRHARIRYVELLILSAISNNASDWRIRKAMTLRFQSNLAWMRSFLAQGCMCSRLKQPLTLKIQSLKDSIV